MVVSFRLQISLKQGYTRNEAIIKQMLEVPAQPQPQVATTPKSTNWKKIVLTVLIIIVVTGLIAGVYWFFVLNKSSDVSDLTGPVPKPQVTTLTPSATPSTKKDETADWKVYINNEFRFSLKYPTAPFCPVRAISVDQNWSGLDSGIKVINFANKYCEDRIMAITVADKNVTEGSLNVNSTWEKTEITIAGLKATKYTKSSGDSKQIIWFVKNDSYTFVITYGPGGTLDIATAEKIISTFKFLD